MLIVLLIIHFLLNLLNLKKTNKMKTLSNNNFKDALRGLDFISDLHMNYVNDEVGQFAYLKRNQEYFVNNVIYVLGDEFHVTDSQRKIVLDWLEDEQHNDMYQEKNSFTYDDRLDQERAIYS